MNAEIQTPVNFSRGSIRDGLVRSTVLRSTLLGEYASLLMMAYALFGAIWWATAAPKNPAALVMVLSGLWIAFRAVGGLAGEKSTAAVSVLMMVMTGVLAITGVSRVPEWMTGSIIAPIVSTILLGVLLTVEYMDLRARSRAGLTNPERRKRDGVALKLAFVGLFLAWGLGVPTVKAIYRASHPVPEKLAMERMSFIEEAGFRCGEAMVTACFFALGANIGSFLNVVVWRMPLGISIVHGDSRCPVCSTKIASRDNIPIFGWLGLGGQCRACGTEIAPRYPIVEAITGTVFLLFYFVELISGGANLPVRGINNYRGVLWIIMYPKWDVIGLYLYHCYLFCVLLVMTLMALDRKQVPRRFLIFAFTVAIGLPLVFPDLALVPASRLVVTAGWMSSAMFVGAGTVVGLLIGCVLHWGWRTSLPHEPNELMAIIPAYGLIGTVLGWQAVLSIATFFCGQMLIRTLLTDRIDRLLWHLFAAVLIHHLLWRLMSYWSPYVWPHATSTATSVILSLVIVAVCVVAVKRSSLRSSGNCRRAA
jgi:leader peptidase (prepilin peptidase)/N-methyltransferase